MANRITNQQLQQQNEQLQQQVNQQQEQLNNMMAAIDNMNQNFQANQVALQQIFG